MHQLVRIGPIEINLMMSLKVWFFILVHFQFWSSSKSSPPIALKLIHEKFPVLMTIVGRQGRVLRDIIVTKEMRSRFIF